MGEAWQAFRLRSPESAREFLRAHESSCVFPSELLTDEEQQEHHPEGKGREAQGQRFFYAKG